MARTPEGPWWWEQKHQYAVTIRGKRHLLGDDEEQADTKFHELMANRDKPAPAPVKRDPDEITVAEVVNLYLVWSEEEQANLTYLWYRKYLQSFIDSLENQLLTLGELEPFHVTKWVKAHTWGKSTRRGAMTAIARALSWAFSEGHIKHNPLFKRLKKPSPGKREKALTAQEYSAFLKHIKGGFEDLVVTAWETGARPQEVVRVEARHVDLPNGRWVFPVEESKGKKAQRIVYLSKKALAITKRLMAKNRKGPLFRTQFGNPWSRFSVSDAFERLKPKVGVKYRLYDFRYSFCTNGLKNGVDPITMQHLMGHKDLAMISRIYALVGQDHQHMRNAAMKAAMRAK